ncbi:MAG: tRNA lysidine(34) synthetase TilS [Gammaproteobacteria bacterium]|nr:tRNA lysidine(34) synthetase TilS [Gammaproteobacteria bacterium]MDH5802931.1 tRNA lysidine(34) synthetase TilS [Gammaproteobacteria bacterium]
MSTVLHTVQQMLKRQPPVRRYWVAFSGGVDSHVLLHCMARIEDLRGAQLWAVHVNHNLMPQAQHWVEHCTQVATQLQVPCEIVQVNAKAGQGESPEAKARQVRYAAFHALMQKNDCLLTAHHQDDQAETLLLQLMRGAGPRGLAAMPESGTQSGYTIMRPMLSLSQEQILDYAQQYQLRWVDDSSNEDCGFDRNYLRHQVIPLLKNRWPAMAKTLSRSAASCAEASRCLDEQGESDLQQVTQGEGLSVKSLNRLSSHRLHNVLRFWIRSLGLTVPNQAVLHEVENLLRASVDAKPLVHWKGAELRRYRDTVYIMAPLMPFSAQPVLWDCQQALDFPGAGCLQAQAGIGCGIKQIYAENLIVRFRTGGERFRQAGHHHSLKNWFQEQGVLPWLRDRIPLLFHHNELVAVGDCVVDETYLAAAEEPGWSVHWSVESKSTS